MGLTRITAGQISNIDYKQAVRVITVSTITLSGGAPTVVDGVTLVLADRILVAGQGTASQNGIYYVTTLGTGSNGTWSRTIDADATGEIAAGMIVMVTEGTTYKDSQWKLTTNNPIVIGTTALTFEQNSAFAFGNVYANGTAVLATTVGDTLTLTAGTNIQITGNATAKSVTIGVTGISLTSISSGTSNVNVVSSGGNVTVGVGGTSNVAVFSSSGANIAGTLGVTGNITGGNVGGTIGTFSGNVTTGNVSGTTGAFTNVGGTLTTAAQTNITSVGTLSSLSVTGNVTGGNLNTGAQVVATGNITGGNVISNALVSAGTVSATGTTTGYGINSGGITTGLALLAASGRSSGTTGSMLYLGGNSNPSGSAGYLVNGQFTLSPQIDLSNWYGLLFLPTISTFSGNIGTMYNEFLRLDTTATGNANITNWFGSYVSAPSFAVGSAPVVSLWVGYHASDPNNAVVNPTTAYGFRSTVARGTNRWGAYYSGTANNYFAGNIGIGVVSAGNALDVSGVAYVSGNVTTGNVSGTTGAFTNVGGTLTTAAQTNVTSVGTLTSLAVTGNITSGNVQGTTHSGTTGTFSGNVNAGNLSGTSIVGTLTTAAQTNITSVGTLTALTLSGNVNMGSKNINNLLDPVSNQDAATKYYVDLVAQGLHIHTSAYVATTGNLATATGGTITYNNGASGVGANLVTTGTYLLIDGGNVQTVGTRILVKNEANTVWNGVYTYSNTTVIVRATDFDNPADVAGGDFLFVTSGTTQADTSWVQTTDAPITFGTSAIVFAQFSGAGTYQAGTGLTLTGQVFSVNASQTQITTVGTLGSLAVTGNITSGNLQGTSIVGTLTTAAQTNITSVGTLGSLAVTGNITSGNVSGTTGAFTNVGGTLTTAAQTNITSVGTLTSLAVTGNITSGNVQGTTHSGTTGTFSGNVTTGNVSGTTGAFTNVGGTLTTAAQTNITSVGTLTSLAVTGNITSGNLQGTSIVGTLTTAAQTNITSVGTLGSLAVTGNISGANLTGTHYGAATGLTSIPGANVTGTVNNSTYFNTVSSVTFAEALRSNRNINGGGTISVNGSGYVGWTLRYIVIANGNGTNFSTSGYFDITQPIVGTITGVGGAANVTATAAGIPLASWQALYYILPIGSNAASLNANFRVVYFTSASDVPHDWVLICVVNGDNSRYYFNNGITLTAGTSYATATYSSTLVPVASSATTAGTVTTAAQPNITSVGTLTSLAVTGNITSGNVQGTTVSGTTGTFTGNVNTANVAATSTISSVTVIASGNVTGGNLITPGLISVTGNVNIGNATGVTWANTSGARVWTYYNNATASLDTVFL